MSIRWLFSIVGILAMLAGTALWLANRPPAVAALAPGALMAASFRDPEGRAHSLGEYQGKVVVLNFWATWCAPCREEMPGFERLQARWGSRGVQFIGVSSEDGAKVAQFARTLRITYPLWTGGDEVAELSKRLGNTLGVLPHTVVFEPDGGVATTRVGAYPEAELASVLERISAKKHVTTANAQ